MEPDQSPIAFQARWQYLALTSLWTLFLLWGYLLPAALLVTLLALSASLMLVTAFRIQKASLKETQRHQQPQSPEES